MLPDCRRTWSTWSATGNLTSSAPSAIFFSSLAITEALCRLRSSASWRKRRALRLSSRPYPAVPPHTAIQRRHRSTAPRTRLSHSRAAWATAAPISERPPPMCPQCGRDHRARVCDCRPRSAEMSKMPRLKPRQAVISEIRIARLGPRRDLDSEVTSKIGPPPSSAEILQPPR